MTALATIAPSPPLDLDSLLSTALVHLSPNTRRVYVSRFRHYYAWWRKWTKAPLFSRLAVQYYLKAECTGSSAVVIKGDLAAIKAVAEQAEANGTITTEMLIALRSLKGPAERGKKTGKWLTKEQSALLLTAAQGHKNRTIASRDVALIALMLGCGLRRSEICDLTWSHFEEVEDGWLIRNLEGKGGRVRTVKIPKWVWEYIVQWGNVIINEGETAQCQPSMR